MNFFDFKCIMILKNGGYAMKKYRARIADDNLKRKLEGKDVYKRQGLRRAEIIVEHTAEPGILLPHDYHRHMQALQHRVVFRGKHCLLYTSRCV